MSEDSSAQDAQFAAAADADVGVNRVAMVYAEAFLGAAEKAGLCESLLAEFDSFVADVLIPNPKFEQVLASALVSPEEKAGILDRALSGRASNVLVNFLKVVGHHERLDCLRAIHRQTRELYDRMRGRVAVRVATARPLSSDMTENLRDRLRTLVDGEPMLDVAVDSELVGGLVVRVGDTVYDGSIATQLKNVRQQMIDRSAHEIQSRRDRFRHPAGD